MSFARKDISRKKYTNKSFLNEKKSFEGGIGSSTTSKDIKVYKKSGIPLRLYDVKGIENEQIVKNYIKIITEYTSDNNEPIDNLHAIFYCLKYEENGTVINEMEIPLFKALAKLDIPILFIITKMPFFPLEDNISEKAKKSRNQNIKRIEKSIKEQIGNLKLNYHIYFMNLVRNYSTNIPPFGFDKLLSFFTGSVTEDDWDNLENSCKKRNEEECRTYLEKNPFLKIYLNFNALNVRNKNEALSYLKGLKAGAFFSGLIPGLDIGMEYYYRHKFKEKLKSLYGFDYEKAVINSRTSSFINEELEGGVSKGGIDNTKLEESKIKEKISKKITNKIRNAFSFLAGTGETTGIGIQFGQIATQFAITETIQLSSLFLLPITSLSFGSISCYNIHKDCHKILNIFENAFSPLKFETLLGYIRSFRKAINYLKYVTEKIIKDDEKENKINN